MEMRRSDRQVSDLSQIYDILRRCDTVTLGLNGGSEPYLIPMTFAAAMENGQIVVYFHSARGGRKWEILGRDPHVCVEGHIYYKTVEKNGGITAQYESVIGTGVAEPVTEKADKIAAFRLMLEQYKHSGFPAQSCKGLDHCDIFRVPLTEVSGKHNL